MSEAPHRFKFLTVAEHGAAMAATLKIGIVDGAIGGSERVASLAALFPHVTFESAGGAWPERRAGLFDILIVAVAATSVAEIEHALRRLKEARGSTQVIVVLRDADVVTTRQLLREGAADVLPAPASEPTLAVALERLLASQVKAGGDERKTGQMVAFLKAGGGVGATTLASQVAAILGRRAGGEAQVCLADLDLQFGATAHYLDIAEMITVNDCLAAGAALEETDFAGILAKHRSGVRVLAAPRELTPLEGLSLASTESLLISLRRSFPLTILELPSVWTSWTNHALQLADRLVLITHLTVPNSHLVRRQLSVLAAQGLQDRPLTLVCNAVSAEQQALVSLKAAESAIGRPFNVVIPEDRRTVISATNEGLELSSVRRGTKVEKAVFALADIVAADVFAAASRKR